MANLIAGLPGLALIVIADMAVLASIVAGGGAILWCLVLLDPKRRNGRLEWLMPLILGAIALVLPAGVDNIMNFIDLHGPQPRAGHYFWTPWCWSRSSIGRQTNPEQVVAAYALRGSVQAGFGAPESVHQEEGRHQRMLRVSLGVWGGVLGPDPGRFRQEGDEAFDAVRL